MFYCDQCAEQHKYPLWMDESVKSMGPCELCELQRPCNDVHHSLLDLGPVHLYKMDANVFLNPHEPEFHAPKQQYRIIGFNLQKIQKQEGYVIIPVNHTEDHADIKKAREHVLNLRGKTKQDSKQHYFIFNDQGFMEKVII